jgi:pimeloyl-ACP methyl ester carboxylesterase
VIYVLSRRFRFVRYDERGCGLSDGDVGRFTMDDWVDDLETVVDAVGASNGSRCSATPREDPPPWPTRSGTRNG